MARRIRCWAIAAGALALCATPIRAADSRFTLDAVLAAPFIDELTAAPHHDALVWTIHERGSRNVAIWKDGTAREITHVTTDDGEELDSVQFVPNETAVVYARGGAGQNADGLNPNPTAPAQRATRKILLTSTVSGVTIDVGDGKEPAVSPRGDRIAWVGKDDQIYAAPIAARNGGARWTAGPAVLLFTVRGKAGTPAWSPDGTRLAITNVRGDHTYIALYTQGARTITFAAPAFSNDQNPVWSPDGTRIAFVRLPGQIATLSFYDDPQSFAPWSIVVADAATGAGRVVWRAPRGRGYEFTIADGVQPLWWSHDDRLAFIWERDGWRHLYAIPFTGGAPRLLTPGPFEIEQIGQSVDGNALLYTSNEGDIDGRHVWSVPFSGGERAALTSGPTNQWSPIALAGGKYAYIDAAYDRSGTLTIANGQTRTTFAAAPVPPEFPARWLVQPKAIVFRAADGLSIHGQLFLTRDPAPHPALIFVHGGPERQMLTTFHYFEAYTNLYELNEYLVSRGFDVLSVNYRSGIMYGHDFAEPPRRGAFGASEYQDVIAGARTLMALPGVDRRRIGIYGLSYGGYLTALALARNSDIFAAGADQAGVHDWAGWIDSFGGQPMGTPDQRAIARDASPIGHVDTWRSPVYLDAGDDDRNVPFAQTVTLAGLLEARGVDVTLHAVPDELHEYTVYAHELDRFERTADFLMARLGAPERRGR